MRVQRDRLPLDALGLVVVAAPEVQRRQGLQAADAAWGELHRSLRRRQTGVELAGPGCRLDQAVPGGVQVGEGEHRPGAGVAGVAPHRFLEAGAHRRVSFRGEGPPVGERALDAVVGEQGLRAGPAQPAGGGGVDDAVDLGQPTDDRRRQLVLNVEDVGRAQRAVVALAPEHLVRRAIGQASGDPHPVGVRVRRCR